MKDFYTPNKVSLGRWNIEKCEKRMFTKTDYSNEDHCGTCAINFPFQGHSPAIHVQSYSAMNTVSDSRNTKEEKYDDDECYKYYLL